MLRKIFLLLLLCIVMGATIAQDNEDTSSLLETISHIPNLPEVRTNFILYADLTQVYAAQEGYVPEVESYEQFEALSNEERSLWARSTTNVFFAANMRDYVFSQMSEMEQVGFDFFDIQRTVDYGVPPSMVTILDVEVNEEQLASSLQEFDYVEQTYTGGTVYCHPDSCTELARQNLRDRLLLFPIIDQLGRYQPVLLTSEYFIMSADYRKIETHVAVEEGTAQSLADVPEYRAAAEAIESTGNPVKQTVFLAQIPELFAYDPDRLARMVLGPAASDEQIAAAQEAMGLNKSSEELEAMLISPFSLAAFADLDAGDDEITLIALVYEGQEQAEVAGSRVIARIGDTTSIRTRMPMSDMLTDRSMLPRTPTVYESESTGLYVTLIPFHRPKPAADAEDAIYHMGYGTFVRMVFDRDLLWLATFDRSLQDE